MRAGDKSVGGSSGLLRLSGSGIHHKQYGPGDWKTADELCTGPGISAAANDHDVLVSGALENQEAYDDRFGPVVVPTSPASVI